MIMLDEVTADMRLDWPGRRRGTESTTGNLGPGTLATGSLGNALADDPYAQTPRYVRGD